MLVMVTLTVIAQNKEKYIGRLECPAMLDDNSTIFIHHSTWENGDSVMSYCLEFDKATCHSRWVAFRFDGQTRNSVTGRSGTFADDPSLAPEYQIGSNGFSGYDKGHICASSDRLYSLKANQQTFYMSNMSPQIGKFNQQYWTQIENHIKDIGRDEDFADVLYVVKGGTIRSDQVMGKIDRGMNSIVIPKYYFIALLMEKDHGYRAIGFWLEHKDYNMTGTTALRNIISQAVTIDQLEELTGIDFFPNLDDDVEAKVESKTITNSVLNHWGFAYSLDPDDPDPLIFEEGTVIETTYDIAIVPNAFGDIFASKTQAKAGTIITLAASPMDGYELDSWTVVDATGKRISVANNRFTMPESNVTISATFNNTSSSQYDIAVVDRGVTVNTIKAYEGTNIYNKVQEYNPENLEEYSFAGWSTTHDIDNIEFLAQDAQLTSDITLYAVYSKTEHGEEGDGNFVKVKTTPNDWNGQYLIVSKEYAANGTIGSKWLKPSNISKWMSGDTVESCDSTDQWIVTIEQISDMDCYTIRFANGQYLTTTNSNDGINLSSTIIDEAQWTFLCKDGDALIYSNKYPTRQLRLNGTSGFRTYSSSTGTVAMLYRKTADAIKTYSFCEDDIEQLAIVVNQTEGGVISANMTNAIAGRTIRLSYTENDGYEFTGWSVVDDESNIIEVVDDQFIMPNHNVTITANFAMLIAHTISVGNIMGGTASTNVKAAYKDASVILTAKADEGFIFIGWTASTNDEEEIEISGNELIMPNADVTIYPIFEIDESAINDKWHLVENNGDLSVNDQIIITAANFPYALANKQNTNNRAACIIVKNGDDTCILNDTIQIITLESGSVNGTYALNVGDGYLYSASSSSNYLKTKKTIDENASWAIDIDATGVAAIESQGSFTHNALRFNTTRYNGTPYLFSSYLPSSTMSAVCIYKKTHTAMERLAYERDITIDQYGTICLPYNVTDEDHDGATFYEIVGKNEEGSEIYIQEVKALIAGVPYIFRATSNQLVAYYSGTSSYPQNTNGLIGTFDNTNVAKGMYTISNNELHRYTTEGTIDAFNAYIDLNAVEVISGETKDYTILYNHDWEDSIERLIADDTVSNSNIYDLTGRKVAHPQKGFYIINGKKALIK